MSSRVLIVSIGQQLPDYSNIYDTFPWRVWLPLQHLLFAVSHTGAIAPGIYRIIAGRWQGSKKRGEEEVEWKFSSPTGIASSAGHVPGLYNIFTTYLRHLYGAFMTAVATLLILSAAYESRGVWH